MLQKIIVTVLCVMICSCTNAKKFPRTPEALTGMAIEIAVKDTHSDTVPEEYQRDGGTIIFYFDNNELFYDATEMNGWHYVSDYTVDKATADSLIITTKVPATGQRSNLSILKQTLVFTGPDHGTAKVEVFEKGKLLFTHSGDFTLTTKTFKLIQREMINTVYTFEVAKANEEATQQGLKPETKIEARFSDNRTIKFIVNNQVFYSENNTVVQNDLSLLTMSGTLKQTHTPYTIDLDYLDYQMGEFSLNLDNGKSKASGKFTSYRFTGVPPVTLKGSLVQGKTFSSAITGVTYPYEIYLPPGYDKSTKRYPVVYTSDGQWQKELANVIDANSKEVILVSIEQGPDDRRNVDYQPPGATAYIKFLKAEFIPFIESNYRTNDIRTYTGQSLGGTLGGLLIAQESGYIPYFKNYILADPAFWALTAETIAMEEAHYQKNKHLPINILLSATWQGNAEDAQVYEQRFRARHYEGLTIINKTYPLTHEEMSSPTFIDYLDFID